MKEQGGCYRNQAAKAKADEASIACRGVWRRFGNILLEDNPYVRPEPEEQKEEGEIEGEAPIHGAQFGEQVSSSPLTTGSARSKASRSS